MEFCVFRARSPPPGKRAPPSPPPPSPAPPPNPPILEVEDLVYTPEYEEEIELDSVPPLITLLGDRMVTVIQREEYTDEGAQAQDAVDGFLKVNVTGLGLINTSLPTEAPFIVTYTAADLSGNLAAPVEREVSVISPCPAPSTLCPLPSVRLFA